MNLNALKLLLATYRAAGTTNPLVALSRGVTDPARTALLRALVAGSPRAQQQAWRIALRHADAFA